MSDTVTKRVLFYFPQCETEKPIVYHLVKDYDLLVNIFRAKVTPEEYGYLVLDLTGAAENIHQAMDYVKSFGVTVDEARTGVRWDEKKCVQCGNCLPHCPTNALHIRDKATREIAFDAGKCVECLNCIQNCPFGACSSLF